MNNDYLKLEFIQENVALITFKQITLTIPFVRAVNDALDHLLLLETKPLSLLTISNHPKIYCAGLNFQMFLRHK